MARSRIRNNSTWDSDITSSKTRIGIAIVLSLFGFVTLFASSPTSQGSEKEAELAIASLKRIFPSAKRIERRSIALSDSLNNQIFERSKSRWGTDSLFSFQVFAGDSLLGIGVVDNVKGKDQPITYLVAFTPALVIKDLEILAYREPYGGEVGFKSWQRQFFDKSAKDNIRHGREIKNISGATISARAITFGIRRILVTLDLLRLSSSRHGGGL